MLVVKTLHFEDEIMPQAKVLDEKELKKVIQFIDAFDRHAERNRAIILLTHYCGMRISEVAYLKTSQVINDDIKLFKDLITSNTGKIVDEEDWGLRELSYNILKFKKAFYKFFQIEISSDSIDKIKKNLNQSDNFLRHLFIKVKQHQELPTKLKDEKK